MTDETCNSAVELSTLAAGMSKQHESYQDALQELVDNAVSAIVSDERYFETQEPAVDIVVTIVRDADTVTTIIADNGPGISRHDLREEVFCTGNKEVSDGILNNVGWGLKASIAWFEQSVRESETTAKDPWFSLITRQDGEQPVKVDGPVTGNLPLSEATQTAWQAGLTDDRTNLDAAESGTRVHVTCARDRFEADVWPAAQSLEIKAQALRERFGVLFRRLLGAREDNQIQINYHDLISGESGWLPVVPITPEYVAEPGNLGTEHAVDRFEITTSRGTFEVEYERGTLDHEEMVATTREIAPGLLTDGDNFRVRYRPSQTHQGVDVYANGRVLMTSVFSELFDLTRNGQYNYFGGSLRIIPANPAETEVPTDNKKTRLDTNSQLWQALADRLATEAYRPSGQVYSDPDDPDDESADDDADSDADLTDEATRVTGEAGDGFGLYQGDARHLTDHLSEATDLEVGEGLLDVTITSPPYADLVDYGYDPDSQIGIGDDYQAYLETLRDIFGQIYDLTAADGSLWVVVNSFKQDHRITNLPADITRICQSLTGPQTCEHCSTPELTVPMQPIRSGGPYVCPNCDASADPAADSWQLQDIIAWDKQRALPYSGSGRCRNVFEYILCFSKQDTFRYDLDAIRIADTSQFKQWWTDYPERYHPCGKVPANIWEMTTPTQGAWSDSDLDHPAPFPPALVERILRLTTEPGDVVFDPFAGSGTVLGQASAMDRRPLGFELSQEYCELYPTVREMLHEQWTGDDDADRATRQEHLTQVIGGLRQVKHARELLRELADAQQIDPPRRLDIEAVFQLSGGISSPAEDRQFISSELLLVAEPDITPRRAAQLEALAAELCHTQPLNGYGIDSSVTVRPFADICTAVADGTYPGLTERLFTYTAGRHYEYEDETAFQEFAERDTSERWQTSKESDIQPIISNLGLEVANPRRSSGQTEPSTETPHHTLTYGAMENAPDAWLSAGAPLSSGSD